MSTALLAAAAIALVYFLTSLVSSRRFMFKLRRAGFVRASIETKQKYSLTLFQPMPKYNAAFAHLLVLKKLMDKLPVDCTTNTSFLEIAKQFPNGLFYFDLWPFAPPLLVVNTPSAADQLAEAPLYKPENINRAANRDLAGGPNLFTMEEKPWKVWRSLFNRGFSAGYMLELVPAIVTETKVFCDTLREHAQRAAMFQLENHTIKLTIDVIGAVAV
jgi:cytochrome P450